MSFFHRAPTENQKRTNFLAELDYFKFEHVSINFSKSRDSVKLPKQTTNRPPIILYNNIINIINYIANINKCCYYLLLLFIVIIVVIIHSLRYVSIM